MENSIRKRLNLQNEVLNWLNNFTEKLQKRANEVTSEVHELVDKTDSVELDLKNTLNSFRSLCASRYVENKVSEEDGVSGYAKEDGKRPAEAGIPAQSYEEDILPRYKEAVALGLSSYRNHMQKTSRSPLASSKTGLANGPLPHIIGSEEYIHDNSCGLSEALVMERASLDFRRVAEPKRVSKDAENFSSPTLFGEDVFGEQQVLPKKEGTEPHVSAALDFKAMLEAALLSSYKFYDEGSSSLSEEVHGYSNPTEHRRSELDHVTTTVPDIVEVATSQQLTGVTDTVMPRTPENLSPFQSSDMETHQFCPELISGSLFDTEEDSPPSSIHESPEALSTENNIARRASGETLEVVNERVVLHDSPFEDDNGTENKMANYEVTSSNASLSSGGVSMVEANELHSASSELNSHVPEEGKTACMFPVTSEDEVVYEGHSQPSDDPQGRLHTDSFDRKVSLNSSMVEGSSSLSLPVKFDDSDGDDNELSH